MTQLYNVVDFTDSQPDLIYRKRPLAFCQEQAEALEADGFRVRVVPWSWDTDSSDDVRRLYSYARATEATL